jgi:hypothetical protein
VLEHGAQAGGGHRQEHVIHGSVVLPTDVPHGGEGRPEHGQPTMGPDLAVEAGGGGRLLGEDLADCRRRGAESADRGARTRDGREHAGQPPPRLPAWFRAEWCGLRQLAHLRQSLGRSLAGGEFDSIRTLAQP